MDYTITIFSNRLYTLNPIIEKKDEILIEIYKWKGKEHERKH